MTGVRPPTVAGVGGGVGVTTVAAGLHGRDGGRAAVAAADVLVCRGTLESLDRAGTVLDHAGPDPLPVLAVVLDGARLPRGVLRERVLGLDEAANGVVLLPRVRHWRELADPSAEAAALLVEPLEHLPRALRAYAAALRELAVAVAESGRLHGVIPAPGAIPAPDPRTGPARGAGPIVPGYRAAPADREAGRGPRAPVAAHRPVVGRSVPSPPLAYRPWPGGPRPVAAPRVRPDRSAASPGVAPLVTPARSAASPGARPRRGVRVVAVPPRVGRTVPVVPAGRSGVRVERAG